MSSSPRTPGTLLQRLAWIALAWNVLVILWGALVRATGSGAGCGNHWPLCNGQVIPLAPALATLIEFTHRCMTLVDVLLVVAVLVGVLRFTQRGHRARIAAVLSTILLVNEALLGALLVKLGYVNGNQSLARVYVLSIHLSNTLLLIAALTLTAELLRRAPSRQRITVPTGTLLWILSGLAATILVGVTGSLAALGDTLFPAATLSQSIAQDFSAAAPWLLRFRWTHPTMALIAGAFAIWSILASYRGSLHPLAKAVVALLFFQFALGLADVILLAPAWMQIVHLLGTELYWIALVLLAAHLLLDAPAAGSARA